MELVSLQYLKLLNFVFMDLWFTSTQGFNSSYISRIKSNINNNSLKNDTVNAFVSIDIEISENTEKNTYTLVREWTFKNKKLDMRHS